MPKYKVTVDHLNEANETVEEVVLGVYDTPAEIVNAVATAYGHHGKIWWFLNRFWAFTADLGVWFYLGTVTELPQEIEY